MGKMENNMLILKEEEKDYIYQLVATTCFAHISNLLVVKSCICLLELTNISTTTLRVNVRVAKKIFAYLEHNDPQGMMRGRFFVFFFVFQSPLGSVHLMPEHAEEFFFTSRDCFCLVSVTRFFFLAIATHVYFLFCTRE